MDFDFYTYLVIPFLIFLSRVADVSLGTVRIILVSKSYKFFAALLGFFEVLIWVIAISKLTDNLDNIVTYVAYAFGFSIGTYVGIVIEEKIAIGTLLLQVISPKDQEKVIEILREARIKTYTVKSEFEDREADILYIIVTRKNYNKVARIIRKHDPKALFSVEDINIVREELDQQLKVGSKKRLKSLFIRVKRKG